MPSNRPAAACLAVLLSAAGCSEDYAHERLDATSAEFVAVQAMLDELRAAERNDLDDALGRQIASGLDTMQEKGLRAVLRELARADAAALQRVDRWGGGLLRATIQLTVEARPRTLAFLLVEADDKLYWAKTN